MNPIMIHVLIYVLECQYKISASSDYCHLKFITNHLKQDKFQDNKFIEKFVSNHQMYNKFSNEDI